MISLEMWRIHTCFVSSIYEFSKGKKKILKSQRIFS